MRLYESENVSGPQLFRESCNDAWSKIFVYQPGESMAEDENHSSVSAKSQLSIKESIRTKKEDIET